MAGTWPPLNHQDVTDKIQELIDTVVKVSGAQDIAGVKKFLNGITLPTSSLPINSIDGLQAALDNAASSGSGNNGFIVMLWNSELGAHVLPVGQEDDGVKPRFYLLGPVGAAAAAPGYEARPGDIGLGTP